MRKWIPELTKIWDISLPSDRCTWTSVLAETAAWATHLIAWACREGRLRGWAQWAVPRHPRSLCCWPPTMFFWSMRLAKDHSLAYSTPLRSFLRGRSWFRMIFLLPPEQSLLETHSEEFCQHMHIFSNNFIQVCMKFYQACFVRLWR